MNPLFEKNGSEKIEISAPLRAGHKKTDINNYNYKSVRHRVADLLIKSQTLKDRPPARRYKVINPKSVLDFLLSVLFRLRKLSDSQDVPAFILFN